MILGFQMMHHFLIFLQLFFIVAQMETVSK